LRAALAKSPGLEAIYLKVRGNAVNLVGRIPRNLQRNLLAGWPLPRQIALMFESNMQVNDYAEEDRREVNPPVEVEA
jgi:hypothetical protein